MKFINGVKYVKLLGRDFLVAGRAAYGKVPDAVMLTGESADALWAALPEGSELADFAQEILNQLADGLSEEESQNLCGQFQELMEYAVTQAGTGAPPPDFEAAPGEEEGGYEGYTEDAGTAGGIASSGSILFHGCEIDISEINSFEDLPSLADIGSLSDEELAQRVVVLLACLRKLGCSDLHLTGGAPAFVRHQLLIYRIDNYVTSPMVKKAHKSIVLRILEQRAKDHYQTVQTNETASWTFPGFYDWSHGNPFVEPAARFRFSNSFSMRDEVRGSIQANGFFGVVSNITQTAVTVPLCLCQRGGDHDVLSFTNTGDKPVMLRPRQDVELLVPADSFAWNLLRSYVVMVSVLALVAAFGIFLGSGLSRPVALFVAFVSLIVVEMGPSVIEQYPDSLETDAVDRFGLSIVRAVETCAKPPSALSPLPKLAADDCVEAKDAFGTFAADFLLAPLVLSLLSALVMRRKT